MRRGGLAVMLVLYPSVCNKSWPSHVVKPNWSVRWSCDRAVHGWVVRVDRQPTLCHVPVGICDYEEEEGARGMPGGDEYLTHARARVKHSSPPCNKNK